MYVIHALICLICIHAPFHALIVLTHGTNQYRYKLISCVVPDDHGKGMQVYNGIISYILCIHVRGFHECMQAIYSVDGTNDTWPMQV